MVMGTRNLTTFGFPKLLMVFEITLKQTTNCELANLLLTRYHMLCRSLGTWQGLACGVIVVARNLLRGS
ncbi:hypothetical protein HanIR_Chr14g0710081 [Helianthus annuus]|nr:hypothetical protein HanIR_Chr14g0710081 [Helianthus annuus]